MAGGYGKLGLSPNEVPNPFLGCDPVAEPGLRKYGRARAKFRKEFRPLLVELYSIRVEP